MPDLSRHELHALLLAHPEGLRLCNLDLASLDLGGLNLDHCDFSGSILRDCNLARARARAASFRGADLCGSNWEKSHMEGALFQRVLADGVSFYGAELKETVWDQSQLSNISFEDADLTRSRFVGAGLKSIELNGARLDGCRFQGSTLMDVSFRDCIFDTLYIDEEQRTFFLAGGVPAGAMQVTDMKEDYYGNM